jgi:spore coat protein U-like protein
MGLRHGLAALAAVLACSWTAPAAFAATGTVTISAVVLSASNCKFRPGSGTLLDFGAIDPSSLTNKTANVTLVIRCQGSADPASFVITAGDGNYSTGPGQPRMRHTVNAAEYLGYSLNTPISGTIPKGVDSNVVVTGTVTPAQFQNALAGSFNDTVQLTLSP